MADPSALALLVLADIHYAPTPEAVGDTAAEYRCRQGLLLVRRAIHHARRRDRIDAIAIAGDLLNDGRAEGAEEGARELMGAAADAAPDTPLLVVPGNHDYDADRLPAALPARSAVRTVGAPGGQEVRFIAFVDAWAEGKHGTRRQGDRDLLRQVAAGDGGPIVVLQHNPMSPFVDDTYPYMLTNREEVLSDYSEAGVLLSISGHLHNGQPLSTAGGVHYWTARSLARPPFPYAIVRIRGREVAVEDRAIGDSALDRAAPPT